MKSNEINSFVWLINWLRRRSTAEHKRKCSIVDPSVWSHLAVHVAPRSIKSPAPGDSSSKLKSSHESSTLVLSSSKPSLKLLPEWHQQYPRAPSPYCRIFKVELPVFLLPAIDPPPTRQTIPPVTDIFSKMETRGLKQKAVSSILWQSFVYVGGVHVYTCIHVCGGQRSTSNVFLNCSPSYFWGQTLIKPGACPFGSIFRGQRASGICLCLPSAGTTNIQCHTWMLGIWTQVPLFV